MVDSSRQVCNTLNCHPQPSTQCIDCIERPAGVDDLQKEKCKLGVYNAEKGERGMLSLQVRFND